MRILLFLLFGLVVGFLIAKPAVSWLVLTDNYVSEVVSSLDSASESIDVALFHIKYYPDYPESSANELVYALINAASRGVKVRILVDDRSGSGKGSAVSFFEDNALDVRFDSNSSTNHNKFVVIDNSIVVVGSHNWSYFALERNDEASVLIKDGEIAEEFSSYFNTLWALS